MRLDQIAKRPGAAPARSAAWDAAPRLRGEPASDPLAQLARLIAQDETFATIVRDNDRTGRRMKFGVRRDERPAPRPAQEDIPSSRDWEGEERSQLAAPGIAEGSIAVPRDLHGWYEHDDGDEPAYSAGVPVQRRWLRLCAATFGLALLGCASALAYRAWFDEPVSRGEAQVTASSTAPVKLVPSPRQADSLSGEQARAQSSGGGGGGTMSGEEKAADAQPAVPQAFPPAGFPSGEGPAQVAALTPAAAPLDNTAAVQDPPPPTSEAAPGSTGPAAREPSAGKYIVQLSSQRSEAAAQTTSRGLQTKYAELFGGLAPFIRRSDLRDKGVYYRVLIGPFAAFGEASQLCGSLKKSGGDCVVQKN